MAEGPLHFMSVCAGIEAASVAWKALGWVPAVLSEIDPFARAVLAHHYPDVPLHGDFTTIEGTEYGPIDVLVGGTPCQDFSIAGLRAGLAGDRGNLTLEFLRLARRTRARWLVWENVPGVLSLDGGRAFGAILRGLGELGYGFAYRVLDAQFAGLAQRRERVFLVASLGDWRRAAAVLFESASLRWDPPPRRQAGEAAARPLAAGSASSSGYRNDADTADNLIAGTVTAKWSKGSGGPAGDECQNLIAHALRAEGFDASEDGTGRGTPLVAHPLAFTAKDYGQDVGELAPTLRGGAERGANANGGVMPAVAFTQNSRSEVRKIAGDGSIVGALAAGPGAQQQTYVAAAAVRRLTPRECERLQGFPDDYTLVPYRGKLAADGPRYKALGNSMAVPVVRWLGQRIAMVDALAPTAKKLGRRR